MELISPAVAYPVLFGQVRPPPEKLYYSGNLETLNSQTLSVIGSRHMTTYGAHVIHKLLPPLIRAGLTIVSGLAYGVDGEAHRCTLEHHGKGIAVLGSALDKIHPQVHQGLADQLVAEGGLILSEYAPESPTFKSNFPARNRIIAALAPVLLIIEAADPSGTFSTARAALDLGKEVCVVPADITREQSAGTLRLLKEGARPVSEPGDIFTLYQQTLPFQVQNFLKPALTGSPATLYACISRGISTVDGLVRETAWNVSTVQTILSVLELDGYITFRASQWQTVSLS
jgi:DNA processing protein